MRSVASFISAGGDGNSASRWPHQAGYSLVELLIVLAIVVILVAIAYPFFGQYQVRADRSDAHAALLASWSTLERCFAEELDYRACQERVPAVSEQGLYQLEVEVESSRFLLRATPAPGSAQEDDEHCQVFTLDHRGERGSEPEGTEVCWGE